jgi:hypothetical protein
MKKCSKCNKELNLEEFRKIYRTGRYQSWCRSCEKIDNNSRQKRHYRKNLSTWDRIIPRETKCQCCGKDIYFSTGKRESSICFDHRSSGFEMIKENPTQWLMKHPWSEKNQWIFESCGFGMLCGKCNRAIPTNNRKQWLEDVTRYIVEEE